MNTANIAGILSTTGSISAQVLARRAEFLDDGEDWNQTGLANTNVIRWNKSNDTYMAGERNLDGGSF